MQAGSTFNLAVNEWGKDVKCIFSKNDWCMEMDYDMSYRMPSQNIFAPIFKPKSMDVLFGHKKGNHISFY